jgi:hypothetical protein
MSTVFGKAPDRTLCKSAWCLLTTGKVLQTRKTA